jgi:hypothetical protein
VAFNGSFGTVVRAAYEENAAGGFSSSGASSGSLLLCMALEAQDAPLAPELLLPESGTQVSATEDASLSWAHRPSVPGGYSDAYRIRFREVGSGTWEWVNASGTAEASETTVTSLASSATLAAAELTAGVSYEWQVATREALDGLWSDYSGSSTFDAVSPPSVTVSAPTGTVSEDLSPTAVWSPTTPEGSQTAFRVRVADLGFDSGPVQGSATSYTLRADLGWQNGDAYTLEVQVQQTGGSWSPWASTSFTVSWTPPADPTISATAELGGVEVVTTSGGETIDLERQIDGGAWERVLSSANAGTFLDVLAPFGVQVAYRARTLDVLEGQILYSDWVTSSSVTSTSEAAYLVSGSDQTNYTALRVESIAETGYARPVAVAYGLGDTRPMVDFSPFAGRFGSLTVITDGDAELQALLGLLGARDDYPHPESLRLRLPPDEETGGGEVITVAAVAPPVVERPQSFSTLRRVSVSWHEI